jgi:autotransporter-associated beta strand protein
MKTLILAAIRCSLMFLIPTVTYAIKAEWDLDPMSADWNTAANWKENKVPNGTADIATFGVSHKPNVSISENTEVDGIMFTAFEIYTITANPGKTLTISGTGITNNSGIRQVFKSAGGGVDMGTGGRIEFTKNASAGINGFYFYHNNGATVSGGSGGVTAFSGNSHAANGDFINDGGTVDGAGGGSTIFSDTSHADSAFLFATGGINGGKGGTILFQGESDGDKSQVAVFGNGSLDLSNHEAGPFTIGSLEGDGRVFVGSGVSLAIGSNNMDTTFSGVIQANSPNADLNKAGTGTLTFAKGSEISFGGDTDIERGVLQVDGSLRTVNTFVLEGATLAGSGTVRTGAVMVKSGGRVMPGSDGAPGTLTVQGDTGNYSQSESATLIIQIASADQFSVLDVSGTVFLNGTTGACASEKFYPTRN